MKKIEINLTDEQLQWLRDHSNGFGECFSCPLFVGLNSGDKCDQIELLLGNKNICADRIKYALEHATKS